jgi:DNA gyrase inhibitor GyrI
MVKSDVKIVELEPMHVATFLGFGTEPEIESYKKLNQWASKKGYMDNPKDHRIFGFNNPDPSPGSPNYGYELWITIDPSVEVEPEIRTVDFSGGLYAVIRCPVHGDPYKVIPEKWGELVAWMENNPYQPGSHQWLEEHIDVIDHEGGEFTLDLYLPISK